MKNFTKRTISLTMVLLLCMVSVFGNGAMAAAAEEYTALLEEYGNAAAHGEISYPFSVNKNTDVDFLIYADAAEVQWSVLIMDTAGEVYDSFATYASDNTWVEELQAYGVGFTEQSMPVGDYTIKLYPDKEVAYVLAVYENAIKPALNQTKATVTVGMKYTLKVDNTSEKVTWKSSKTSVAKVSSKGVVTGVKAGNATITASLESGAELKCKVTVKANKFTEKKMTANDMGWNMGCHLQVYAASYDAKGNLVMKCRFINNSGYKVTKLENVKIKMISAEGKTIGTYTAKSKSLAVANGATKDFSVTISKSKLKIKKADLRNATYERDGDYIYQY